MDFIFGTINKEEGSKVPPPEISINWLQLNVDIISITCASERVI